MNVRDAFDEWAQAGRDRGMEQRHWHTAKHALARMPVEADETVLDLGTGSGYALRALADTRDVGHGIGVDGSQEMAHNARSYADDDRLRFLQADFHDLPLADDSVDHVWSMEAFYYATDAPAALAELRRVLRPGGTFYCAVNYWADNVHSAGWEDLVGVSMTRWSEADYRERFREAGFDVASQDRIPDEETEIPGADAFPTDDWDSREAMVERYREYGTLLTVGVART
jgi:SAM-dependent methyltransferase